MDVLGETGINPLEGVLDTFEPVWAMFWNVAGPVLMVGVPAGLIGFVLYMLFVRWSNHGVDL